MLTIDHFRTLPFEKKCDVITYNGNYLMQRELGDSKVFLYYADGFFIEVFYSTVSKRVMMINAFEKTTGIAPYLELISLSSMMEKGEKD